MIYFLAKISKFWLPGEQAKPAGKDQIDSSIDNNVRRDYQMRSDTVWYDVSDGEKTAPVVFNEQCVQVDLPAQNCNYLVSINYLFPQLRSCRRAPMVHRKLTYNSSIFIYEGSLSKMRVGWLSANIRKNRT